MNSYHLLGTYSVAPVGNALNANLVSTHLIPMRTLRWSLPFYR